MRPTEGAKPYGDGQASSSIVKELLKNV